MQKGQAAMYLDQVHTVLDVLKVVRAITGQTYTESDTTVHHVEVNSTTLRTARRSTTLPTRPTIDSSDHQGPFRFSSHGNRDGLFSLAACHWLCQRRLDAG